MQGFVWQDQLRVAAELDGASNVITRFVHGERPNVPELMLTSMNTPGSQSLSSALRALLGAQIASIAFVEDYVQIEVSGGRMSILESLRVEGHGHSLTRGDPSFTDELKSCTGAAVEDVQVNEDQVFVRLSNGKTLKFALLKSTGTKETFIYQSGTGRMWVAGPA